MMHLLVRETVCKRQHLLAKLGEDAAIKGHFQVAPGGSSCLGGQRGVLQPQVPIQLSFSQYGVRNQDAGEGVELAEGIHSVELVPCPPVPEIAEVKHAVDP